MVAMLDLRGRPKATVLATDDLENRFYGSTCGMTLDMEIHAHA